MLKYKPKYFNIKKYSNKVNFYHLKVFIILLISISIMVFVIYTAYNLFINSPKKIKESNLLNEQKILNDLRQYYISGKFELLKDSIENLLIQYKFNRNFKKDLLYLYFNVCISLKNFDYFEKYFLDYNSLFEKDEKEYILSYLDYKKGNIDSSIKKIERTIELKKIVNKDLNIENFNIKLKNIYNFYSTLLLIEIFKKKNDYNSAIKLLRSLINEPNYGNFVRIYNNENSKLDNNIFNSYEDVDYAIKYNLSYFLFLNNKIMESLEILEELLNKKMKGENEKSKNFLVSNIYFILNKNNKTREFLKESKNFGLDIQTFIYNYLLTLFNEKDIKYKNFKDYIYINDLEIKKEFLFDPYIFLSFIYLIYLQKYYDKVVLSYNYYYINKRDKILDNLDLYNERFFYIDYIYIDSFFELNKDKIKENKKIQDEIISKCNEIFSFNLNSKNFIFFAKTYLSILIYIDRYNEFNDFVNNNIDRLKNDINIVNMIIYYNILKQNYKISYNFLSNYFEREKDPFYFYYFWSIIELFEKDDINQAYKTIINLENVKLTENLKDRYYFYKAYFLYLKNDLNNSFEELQKINTYETIEKEFFLYVCLKLEKYDEILKYYDKFKSKDEIDYNLYLFYGIALYKKGYYEDSLNYLLKILESTFDNKIKSIICTYIGNIYYYLNSLDNAINYYQEALIYNKDNFWVKINLNRINKK